MATQSDIADHVGVTQPAVAALVRAGVISAAARGGYDLDACRLAYCSHLREQAAGRAGQPGAALDLATERARLAAAQAELIERKNARERGDIMSRAAVDGAVTALVTMTVARLDRVGASVAGSDHKLRKRIEAAVNDALRELSETTPESIVTAANGFDVGESGDSEG